MKISPQIQKTWVRFREQFITHRLPICIGVSGSLLLWMAFAPGSSEQTKVIFKKEGIPDFSGASILGNPSAHILTAEQNQLSKRSQNVLAVEGKLQAQVDSLKAEIASIKGGTAIPPLMTPSPNPSPSSLGMGVQAQLGGLTAHSSEIYGPPTPLSSPVMTPIRLSQAPESFSHTEIKDQIRTTHAAPRTMELDLVASSRKVKLGNGMISFPAKSVPSVVFKKPGIILPSGSYVKGKLLTGVEAPEGKTYPALLQLDYAYITPNDKRLDLTGCFMIAKATGNLSSERVEMQPTKLSCVSKRGGMFEREVTGFVADDVDNSFGIIGSVNTKQDRVAAVAFLASVAAGIGKAIQQAQTTQQTTPLGGSQSVLTGDSTKFIAAGGASDAATQVTQWYLAQAKALLPTLNVGSGASVWMVMTEQVELPKDYFTQNKTDGGTSDASLFSYLTRTLD